jgi:hypothetical protein
MQASPRAAIVLFLMIAFGLSFMFYRHHQIHRRGFGGGIRRRLAGSRLHILEKAP